MKIKDRIRLSIRIKVQLILFGVLVVPLATLCIVFSGFFAEESKKNYVSNNIYMVDSVNKRLDDYIEQLDTISRFVFYDDTPLSLSHEWEIYNHVLQRLLYAYSQRGEIDSLVYYFPENDELYVISQNGNRSFLDASDVEQMPWYLQLKNGISSYQLEGHHTLEKFNHRYQLESKAPVFSLNKKFRSGIGKESYLSINFKYTYMEQIFDRTISYPTESIQYLNKNGELIYFQGDGEGAEDQMYILETIHGRDEPQGSFTQWIKGKGKCTVIYKKSAINETVLYKCISNRVMNQHVKYIIYVGILTFVAALLIVIPIGMVLSGKITNPLINLERHMKQMGQGDLSVRVPVNSVDEIGTISQSFNQMVEKIEQLVNEQYKLKLSYRTAQLYSLIAQINPHFLNNTLQAISGVALERGVKEIHTVTSTLGKMLHYSIKEKDVVELKAEIQNVQDYLFIQKFRYEKRLEYVIEASDAAQKQGIPKLILQPLVENSIIHGLEGGKNTLHMKITAVQEEEQLCITIEDDGCGIPKERLREIRGRMEKNKEKIEIESHSIGFINVYQRLYLMYEDRFKMNIDSEEGQGTRISIYLSTSVE